MNTTLMFVLLAFTLLMLFAYLAFRRSRGSRDLGRSVTAIRLLDMEAFRNLVDPEEEEFLRAYLTVDKFRKIKRERARAALAYVKELLQVSLEFARVGDVAQRSPDPVMAAWGKQIANSAIYLRLRALEASTGLILAATFPSLSPRPLRALLDQYDRANCLLLQQNGLGREHGQTS